jgi:hypothetical protein
MEMHLFRTSDVFDLYDYKRDLKKHDSTTGSKAAGGTPPAGSSGYDHE